MTLHPSERIIGNSPAIRELRKQIERLTAFDSVGNPYVPTLLLQGETGTGKGLVARTVHEMGARESGPFVDVNCAAIPDHLLEAELYGFEVGAFTDARRPKPGLFEAASRGTLFLDEVDALPLTLQGKLLRSVEDKRVRRLGSVTDHDVDVKIIAAAQLPLSRRVADGRFRSDLYHRLAIVVLEIPALRDRGEDVLDLARYFLRRYSAAHGVDSKQLTVTAESWLRAQPWPGNVRELSHLMERVVLLLDERRVEGAALERLCLAGPPGKAPGLPATVENEAARIRRAIAESSGNVLGAARLLGLSRNALRYRMQRYGISRRDVGATPRPSPQPTAAAVPEPVSRGAITTQPQGPESIWEKKPVAVLAIELTFKTEGREVADQQPWTLARRWGQICAEKAQGFGGLLLERAPSLYTVVFGVPSALDRMHQRALHAALAIRHLVEEGADADVRLGIHLGEVLVDRRAPSTAGNLLAVGDTLALPVRLLALASSREIIVSSVVGRLIEQSFDLEPRSLSVTATSASGVTAYAVTGRRSEAGPPPGASRSRFVGRRRELDELVRALGLARQSRGQVVGVVGEAGVGKSRLCSEFLRVGAADTLVLESAALSHGQPHAFLPLIEMLWRYFAIEAHDGEETRREKICRRILALDPGLEDRLPYLLALLGVSDATSDLLQMEPELRRARTMDVVKAVLLRESLIQPVLLVFEDLHWLDGESLAFLEALVESLPEARLLVIMTYRPEYQHRWGGKSCYVQVRLDPLRPDEARELLAGLVAGAATLRQLIASRAQGNPFFIEEMVQALVDRGVLVRDGVDGAVATPAATELPADFVLPPTIQGLLAARIDRLASAERALLQTAAAMGPTFSLGLIQRVAGAEVRAGLSRLCSAEFIHERAALGEPTYVFKHALTQDVAYGSLLPDDRRRLHQRAAEAIEAIFHDHLDDHYGVLADHYHRAGATAKAVEYLGRAAEQAVQRSAYTEAMSQLRAALTMVAKLPSGRERNQRELLLQTALGAAIMATQGMGAPEIESIFSRAGELCREVGETPELFRVLQGLGVFYAMRLKLDTAEELLERRRRLAEKLTHPAFLPQAQIAHGHFLLARGDVVGARAELEQGMARYDPRQHHTLAFGAGLDPSGRDHAALVLWLLGHPDRALSSLRESLAFAETRPHPFGLAVGQIFAAMLHQLRRETAAVRQWAEAAIATSTEHGFVMFSARSTMLKGWALSEQGEPELGVADLIRGLAADRATGAELLRPYFLGLLAEAEATAGRIEEAIDSVSAAIDSARTSGERWWEPELLRLKGALLLRRSGTAETTIVGEAEAYLQEALALAGRRSMKSLELRAATALARLWREHGKPEEARALLLPVYEWFGEGLSTPDLVDARALLSTLAVSA